MCGLPLGKGKISYEGGLMKTLTKLSLFALAIVVTACGLPTNKMSAKERRQDMEWAFTVFNHNYAPAQLKKNNYGVELSKVEADCITLSESEMTNTEFLALFQKCVHSFKDAHVGAQQLNNGMLPEFAEVAHLGFLTMRTKIEKDGQMIDALRIVEPLKGSDKAGAPLVKGDLIVEVDGQSVSDHLQQEIVPYIDLGQDESNLTVAAFRFSVRTSIDMALPAQEDVKLQVIRGGSSFEIQLPWIVQDMLSFQLTQNPPEENPEKPAIDNPFDDGLIPTNALAQGFFGYNELKSLFQSFKNPVDLVMNPVRLIAEQGFRMAKFNPIMNSLLSGKFSADRTMDLVLRTRILPKSETVTDLMVNPMFTAKLVNTDSGVPYAYIQIKSFPADDKVLTEWYRAITAIQDKGVKSVIIDMVDNTGGSLVHGMRMLNMLRKKPLDYPSIQVRLNNNWMNSFKRQAAFGEDDYAKTIGARVAKQLEADKQAGKSISRPISIKVLDPFFLQNPTYGLEDDVKVALLVNEMCISMCDIFASVFQDNDMGEVIGQRTMGGGGNVTQHGLSPVAKMGIALTESLIISAKGVYLEDNGVTPDITIDMVADREGGFKKAFEAAYNYVTGGQGQDPVPTADTFK
jgi:C-terminal processing protease CtpA/Prc